MESKSKMRVKIKGFVLLFLVNFIFYFIGFLFANQNYDKNNSSFIGKIYKSEISSTPKTEWELFLDALSYVESRNNDNAIGTCNDVGRYQITPIFVKEVNRLSGYDKYSLTDRTDSLTASQIVTDMNKYRNPNFDIEKAIKLHNKNAPESYRKQILSKLKELKNS